MFYFIGIDAFIEPEEGGETIPRTLEDVLVFCHWGIKDPTVWLMTSQPLSSYTKVLQEQKRIFPEANTCALKLWLPVHATFEYFMKWMTFSIQQSPTFGKA
jgi:hypothetical protein